MSRRTEAMVTVLLVVVGAAMTLAAGAIVVFAIYLTPSEIDRGSNVLSPAVRWVQLVLALTALTAAGMGAVRAAGRDASHLVDAARWLVGAAAAVGSVWLLLVFGIAEGA